MEAVVNCLKHQGQEGLGSIQFIGHLWSIVSTSSLSAKPWGDRGMFRISVAWLGSFTGSLYRNAEVLESPLRIG